MLPRRKRSVPRSVLLSAEKLVEATLSNSLSQTSGPKIRLGLVGLGKMGMLHWQTWQGLPEVSITGVVDSNPAKAPWAAVQGIPFFSKSEALLGLVDAVIIANPADQHFACALPLLSAGVHCLIEKPIALSLEDARQIVAAANRRGVILAVGHSERFNPALQQVCDANGLLASTLEVFRMAPAAHPGDATADVVQDLMVHDIDWVIDAIGQLPVYVRVTDAHWLHNSLCHVYCELGFAGGIQVALTASCLASTRRREVILHSATGQTMSINLDLATTVTGDDPLTRQARAFLQALHRMPSRIATGADALRAMTLVEQIRADCKNTLTVAL